MTNYDKEQSKILIGVIVGMVLLAAVTSLLIYSGIVATREDREWRARRATACTSIEDQALRTLCVVKGP